MAEFQGESEGDFWISGLSGMSPSEFAQRLVAGLRVAGSSATE